MSELAIHALVVVTNKPPCKFTLFDTSLDVVGDNTNNGESANKSLTCSDRQLPNPQLTNFAYENIPFNPSIILWKNVGMLRPLLWLKYRNIRKIITAMMINLLNR